MALIGCPADDDGGGGGGGGEMVWEEGGGDNEEPWDAEAVDDGWTDTLVIQGSMERCDYNQSQEWEYTGDNDSFETEVPDDGYMDAELVWEHDSNLDMFVYINAGGQNWEPEDSLTRNGDAAEQWIPEDEFESGDDIVFTVVCRDGDGGDYTLTVNWES